MTLRLQLSLCLSQPTNRRAPFPVLLEAQKVGGEADGEQQGGLCGLTPHSPGCALPLWVETLAQNAVTPTSWALSVLLTSSPNSLSIYNKVAKQKN